MFEEAELPESLRNGVYANWFSVAMSEHEAIIDLANALPLPGILHSGTVEIGKPIVVARVITSKEGATKLRDLLDEMLKKSEQKNIKKKRNK